MTTTPNLAIAYIDSGVPQPEVTHNDAIRSLDALVQLIVQDRDLATPPGSPSDGQRWIVAASPTGAWTGHTNHVLAWQDGAWRSYVPKVGWLAYVVDEGMLLAWSGSAWVGALSMLTALQNLVLLGVGTTADSTNPFSAKLNNALWVAKTVAEGGDGNLRYKLSKESASKTLSLLMQANSSDRAEFGLTGDDDFHFKVSPDGTSWVEALAINRSNGGIRFLAAQTDAASAATCDIGAAANLKVQITGTTAITSFGTVAHAVKFVRFAGALTLTHNATSLILPGAANIATAAGDTCIACSDSSGNWRVFAYQRASGKATVAPASTDISDASATGRALLTAPDVASARVAVLAAPIEAMADRVLNLNPGMEVDQEHAGASTALTGTGSYQTKYLIDGVMAGYRGTFVAAAQQVSDCPAGYLNSLKFTVSTAESSLGANDELSVLIPIEGVRCSKLYYGNAGANALAIFFFVKAHRTGSYSGSVRNSAKTRSYPFSFTVNSADTWEYKSILIATGDTAGTWLTTTGVGLFLNIAIAAGSSRVGSASAWAGSDYSGVTGTANGVAATSDVFQIAGVGTLPLVAGVSVADVPDSAHAPFVVRPFDVELSRCQRYYWKTFQYGTAPAQNSGTELGALEYRVQIAGTTAGFDLNVRFPTIMRVAPTLTFYNPAAANASWRNSSAGADSGIPSASRIGDSAFAVYNPQAAGDTAGHAMTLHATGDARL